MKNPIDILYPLLGMFILVMCVLLTLAFLRIKNQFTKEVDPDFFKTFQGGDEPPHMKVVSRNLMNLFEMPVLFYVVILIYFVAFKDAGGAPHSIVTLAWAYTILRAVHSLIHITFNFVPLRFTVFLFSNIVLILLWVSLFHPLWDMS